MNVSCYVTTPPNNLKLECLTFLAGLRQPRLVTTFLWFLQSVMSSHWNESWSYFCERRQSAEQHHGSSDIAQNKRSQSNSLLNRRRGLSDFAPNDTVLSRYISIPMCFAKPIFGGPPTFSPSQLQSTTSFTFPQSSDV